MAGYLRLQARAMSATLPLPDSPLVDRDYTLEHKYTRARRPHLPVAACRRWCACR